MKKFMFLVVAVAVFGYYGLPVFLAKAEANPVVPVVGGSEDASVLHLRVTAYASEVDETDDTPFVTANGTYVHDGIVATNVLPFGTKVEIPALFGDKIFTVEDRMNAKMKNRMDVWMPTRQQAINFGANYADIIVLPNATSSPVSGSIADIKK